MGDYPKAYQELSRKAESILCITYRQFGMGYKTATQAKVMARKELSQTAIEVIDSRTGCATQLLLVLAGAKAAAQGKSLPEVTEIVNSLILRLNLMDVVPTLQPVEEGRAISKGGGRVEPAISTQSIMEQDASAGGATTAFARVATGAKGMEKIIEIVNDRSKGGKLHAAITCTTTLDDAQELKKRLLAQFQCAELYVTEESPVPPIHEGLG